MSSLRSMTGVKHDGKSSIVRIPVFALETCGEIRLAPGPIIRWQQQSPCMKTWTGQSWVGALEETGSIRLLRLIVDGVV
ncbi:hypothetical protein LMG27952_00276 [Paraburkholderia hiiakae]|uniref:Uncharacterized protein n=1 Tax=Paraburkholderia hiiakae TaxID=1081782 RepID=A0ABM8N966_9BURK|nr:hypothetical protein LMG27952_00276 [Paraburkholderia hiiakae]